MIIFRIFWAFIFCYISSASLVLAQFGNSDLPFFAYFSPLNGSPANSRMFAVAQYYHYEQLTPYNPDGLVLTNALEFDIWFGGAPQEAWLMEQQRNGKLEPVFQFTNLNTYVWQRMTITKSQVHSMIKGNWFIAVDYGTSNTDFSLRLHYFEDAGKTGACRSDTA
jgi:hypothetical protein